MLDARGKRIEHCARRAKIRVGDPQRDDVAAGVAVPAQAPGACPVHREIKIVRDYAYFLGGFDASFSCSSSYCGCCSLYGSSSSLFMLSSTFSVGAARASFCSCSGNVAAMLGTNITTATAMHCSTMNSNMPL